MKISTIRITKLFGLFNYDIRLDHEENLTILIAPNGFGKTSILRLLFATGNLDMSVLLKIPFRNFTIKFEDKSTLSVSKKLKTLTFQYKEKNSKAKNYSISDEPNQEKLDKLSLREKELFLRMKQKFPNSPDSALIQELYRTNLWRNWNIYGHEDWLYPEMSSQKKIPDWLKNITDSISIYFIKSDRLNPFLNIQNRKSGASVTDNVKPVVESYSREIIQIIEEKEREFSNTTNLLDSTFPQRVIEKKFKKITDIQLIESYKLLLQKRERLIKTGILDQVPIINKFEITQSDEYIKSIIGLYINDNIQKLSTYDDLLERLEIFKNILNKRFKYKEVIISKNKGFEAKLKYKDENINVAQLSSGEQHELVMIYELLFVAKENSVILIDEPEISFHIAWQRGFISDLLEISKLRNLYFMIATHSADIIDDKWDLTVELEKWEEHDN